jgi:hypothetical protein
MMNFIRNKTRLKGDIYTVMRHFTINDKVAKWTTVVPTVIEKVHMQRIDWTVVDGDGNSIACQFHVMRCAAKTEFCTEVHMIVTVTEENAEQLDSFSCDLLEKLRVYYNKTWVIGDHELNASIFLESF